MPRKVAYWGATGLVGIVTLFAGFNYLTSAPEAIENFRHVGYPQQLRVLLGIGKLAGAIGGPRSSPLAILPIEQP